MKITVTSKGTHCELFKSDCKKIDDVISLCRALERHHENMGIIGLSKSIADSLEKLCGLLNGETEGVPTPAAKAS